MSRELIAGGPTREVVCGDALAWLAESPVTPGRAFVASLPDISEFSGASGEEYRAWFISTASLILKATAPDSVTIFYQSDIKLNGRWVDKGFYCMLAADALGVPMLWHKIGCRIQPGQASFGRPGYSHILCFSKELSLESTRSSPDVLPDIGDKAWARGMGVEATLLIARFVKEHIGADTIVNPFCGVGSMLAVANAVGLNAIGIERSRKRAEQARALTVNLSAGRFILDRGSESVR